MLEFNFLKNGAIVVAIDINENTLEQLSRELKDNNKKVIIKKILYVKIA